MQRIEIPQGAKVIIEDGVILIEPTEKWEPKEGEIVRIHVDKYVRIGFYTSRRGGNKLPYEYGFKAHSDGDVLIHSVIDALLGAAGAGDIGEFFPDTDPKYKGVDSKILLNKIVSFINNVGYEIVNVDVIIIAQIPKINPFKNDIKNSMAKLLKIQKQFLNIKATTAEKMGFIGRCEGIAVQSIATLKYYDWKKDEHTNY